MAIGDTQVRSSTTTYYIHNGVKFLYGFVSTSPQEAARRYFDIATNGIYDEIRVYKTGHYTYSGNYVKRDGTLGNFRHNAVRVVTKPADDLQMTI